MSCSSCIFCISHLVSLLFPTSVFKNLCLLVSNQHIIQLFRNLDESSALLDKNTKLGQFPGPSRLCFSWLRDASLQFRPCRARPRKQRMLCRCAFASCFDSLRVRLLLTCNSWDCSGHDIILLLYHTISNLSLIASILRAPSANHRRISDAADIATASAGLIRFLATHFN